MRGRQAGFLALALALAAPPVLAQSSGPSKAGKGRFRLGPLWFTPRIVLRNAGNDTNVFNDPEQSVSDRSAVLEPSVDALLPVGSRFRVLGTGAVGFNYFHREVDERSTDLMGSLRGELDAGPATFYGGVAGAHHKQRFSLEVDQRLERRDENVSAGVDLRLGRRLQLGGGLTDGSFRYQQGVAVNGNLVDRSLDRDTRSYTGRLSYSLTAKTSLQFSADVLDDTFLGGPAGPDEVVRSYRYQGGFGFGVGALFTGQALAGWRHFPGDSLAAPAADGLVLSVDLNTPLGQLGSLQLNAARDINYAVERAGALGRSRNSYEQGRYGAILNTELPWSLIARGSLFFDRADYILPYTQDGAPLDRVDKGRTYGLGLLRAFGRSFRVGGTIEWWRRRSNREGFDYERRVYGLTAEYTP